MVRGARRSRGSVRPVWIDTHCHIQEDPVPAPILAAAHDAGVTKVICIGTAFDESRRAITLARASSMAAANRRAAQGTPGPLQAAVFATVGLHPHEASLGISGLADLVESAPAADGRRVVVGIGECGLDYHYDHSPRSAQREAFAQQIALASRFGLPLVIHSRDAWEDTFAVLKSEGVPERLVFHSFTGGPEEARRCLDVGGYVSFSGIITFKKADDVRAAAALCPVNRIFLETDSPYLTPVPYRGKRNEPMYIPLVGATVAEAKGLAVEDVAAGTSWAAETFFGLELGPDEPA